MPKYNIEVCYYSIERMASLQLCQKINFRHILVARDSSQKNGLQSEINEHHQIESDKIWSNCFPPSSQYIGVSGLFTPNWRRSWMGAGGYLSRCDNIQTPAYTPTRDSRQYIFTNTVLKDRHDICSSSAYHSKSFSAS